MPTACRAARASHGLCRSIPPGCIRFPVRGKFLRSQQARFWLDGVATEGAVTRLLGLNPVRLPHHVAGLPSFFARAFVILFLWHPSDAELVSSVSVHEAA